MIRLICACLIISGTVYGSGQYIVPERLFKMTGAEVNVTEGDLLYKSQSAGYYTGGGGMVVRSPIKSSQLASVHLPKIQSGSGCGGLDIYTGGFTFINGKQLVETLQAISSNAAGFAFMLGLETVSPMISNNMRQLQSWANTINGIGINSCETAAQLVGSVWPASDMANQHICRTIGANNKVFADYIDGRNRCASLNKEKQKQQNEFLPLAGEYNIAWEALMSQPFFKDSKNKEMAEMYMTFVGTLVVREENIVPYFSKAEESDFLTRLLEGGKVTKYTCEDKKKCLVVLEKEEEISVQDSWFAKIRIALMNMQKKAADDEPLDSSEKGLLCTSRLPLSKIVNVLSAYHRGAPCPVDMDSIADIVTWDILAQVINEAIETVRRGCMYLRANSMYVADVDRYLEDLERVRKVVKRYEEHAHKAIDLEMRLIQKMQLLEKQINSEIMVN